MVIQHFSTGDVKISQGDWALNFADGELRIGGRDGFVISGPGEYEVDGTFIRGIASLGPENKINTIYSVRFDDMHLVHLNMLESADISSEAKEIIGEADILFLPEKVEKLGSTLNPKIIIPIYKEGKNKSKDVEAIDKLVIKRKDLEGKEGEVIAIQSE